MSDTCTQHHNHHNQHPRRGRFAPSPSGRMHLGNIFCFLMAWLSIKSHDGSIILRIEDLDSARCHAQFAYQIMDDLEWLGLTWDEEPLWQHDRTEAYEDALERLISLERVYPCYCSRADWHAASAPHVGDHFIYPGTCRHLSPDERTLKATAKDPSWRFYVGEGTIDFDDMFQGHQHFDVQHECGDCVVRRSDGVFAYQLAVVVDDAYQGIDEICRGYDLLDSTPTQIALQRALGLPTPEYAHVPILMNEDGHRLAKRDHDMDMGFMRDHYKTPEVLYGHLMHMIGWQDCPEQISLDDLLRLWHVQDIPCRELIVHPDIV